MNGLGKMMDAEQPVLKQRCSGYEPLPSSPHSKSNNTLWYCGVVVVLLLMILVCAMLYGSLVAKAVQHNPLDESFEILGLKNDATLDEIKKQYRKLYVKFHPNYAGVGVDNEITRIINAYTILREALSKQDL
jgi:preprotein translocase subunit Sec63